MSIELKVPHVGESVTEVYIGRWYKSEGDQFAQDEEIVELESDKATFDVPAPAAGVISKILKQPGDTAAVGDVIAVLDTADAESGKRPGRRDEKGAEAEPQESASARTERAATERLDKKREQQTPPGRPEGTAGREEPRVMPAARRVLEEHGLAPGEIEATGPGGRLLKEDVLRHVERTEAPKAPRETRAVETQEAPQRGEMRGTERVPMSPIRRTIAARLVEAQHTAALLTTFNEIDMSAVQALRKQYRDEFQERYGVKLGFMSFFVKAAVDALKQFPQVNAEIRGDDVLYHNYYDIGVAIGGGKGLVVPVLRNAERMSFAEIERTINDFAARARENRIGLAELQGGTFTISNGGVYGSLLSTPIVNPPQSGVLGLHAIQDRPVVRDGNIVVRPMMYVALTYDHRIVDGREAVTFLKRIKQTIEEPARMLLEA